MNFKQRLDRFLTQSDEPIKEDNRMDIDRTESLEFANDFNYDQYGLITNPGKFERREKWLPYFYNMALLGAQDDIIYDYLIDDDEECDQVYDIFNLCPEDWELFPDLVDVKMIAVWEGAYGFVYSELDPNLSLLMS